MAEFDIQAGETWIYPINYPIREYQFDIVKAALFKNTLVCLPTGLGKTFIGAVLMYNFYRWYPTGKVIFLAPSRPLVTQQIEACFHVMGIPQEHMTEMTGTIPPAARPVIWQRKRVLFLTPQVLLSDLSRESCPTRVIKLIVIDEAHKALKMHSFCQVMKQMKQQCYNFRVVALTATPGSNIRAIQEVITNLSISHIELRNDDSPDIAPYIHLRRKEKIVLPIEGELKKIQEKYLQILKYYVLKLINYSVLYTKDETTTSKFEILLAREAFRRNPPQNCTKQISGFIEGTFALCITLYHAYELLLKYSIHCFLTFLKDSLDDKKGTYGKGELKKNSSLMELIESLSAQYNALSSSEAQGGVSTSTSNDVTVSAQGNAYLVTHPKMEKLQQIILDHFSQCAGENEITRAIIFSKYRNSAIEIAGFLRAHGPLIKPISFLGQSSQRENGVTQKEQIRVIREFRAGTYNTLISTCIGEEGLDIGEVDLIVCYDALKSPISLTQRIGRTGRKRAGRILFLVMEGDEEKTYNVSLSHTKSLARAIQNGNCLKQYLSPHSARMVPEGIEPSCLKMKMAERTYDPNLKQTGKSSKKPRGVFTGLSDEELKVYEQKYKPNLEEVSFLPRPSFGIEKKKLKASAEDLVSDLDDLDTKQIVDLSDFQPWYTTLQPGHKISHSKATHSLVHLSSFIRLQKVIGDNDNYGMELAPFLHKWLHSSNALNPRKRVEAQKRNDGRKRNCKKNSKKGNLKQGIKSFLIKVDSADKAKYSLASLTNPKKTLISTRAQPHLDHFSTESCLKDITNEEMDNDVLLHDSDLEDFDLPVRESKEVLGREVACPFGKVEGVFLAYSDYERRKVLISNPPNFIKAELESFWIRPSHIREIEAKLQEEGLAVELQRLASCFSDCEPSYLLKGNSAVTPPSLRGSPCEIVSRASRSSLESLVDIEVVDLEFKTSSVNAEKICFPKVNDTISDINFAVQTPHQSPQSRSNNRTELPVLECTPGSTTNWGEQNECSSVLLTPPPAVSGTASLPLRNHLGCSTSPCFASRRLALVDPSSSIISSTPVPNKSKRLFGNSSINITPISLTGKRPFASPCLSTPQHSKRKVPDVITPTSSGDFGSNPDQSNQTNHSELGSKKVKDKPPKIDPQFELGQDDDDLFANIDLEAIVRESNVKKIPEGQKNKAGNISNLIANSLDSIAKVRENHACLPEDENNKSLLTVTQIIDLVNEPTCSAPRILPKPLTTSELPGRLKEGFSSIPAHHSDSVSEFPKPAYLSSFVSCMKRKADDFPQSTCKFRNLEGVKESLKNCPNSQTATRKSVVEEKTSLGATFLPANDNEVRFNFGLDGFEAFDLTGKESDKKSPVANDANVSEDMFDGFDVAFDFVESSKIGKGNLLCVGSKKSSSTQSSSTSTRGVEVNYNSSFFHPFSDKPLTDERKDLTLPDKVTLSKRNLCTLVDSHQSNITPLRLQRGVKTASQSSHNSCLEDSPIIRRKVKANLLDSRFDESSVTATKSKLSVCHSDDSSSTSKSKSSTKGNFSRANGIMCDFDILSDDDFEVRSASSHGGNSTSTNKSNSSTKGNSSRADGIMCDFGIMSDDDFEASRGSKLPRRQLTRHHSPPPHNKKIKKKAKPDFLETEANVTDVSIIMVSSDESENSLDVYDSSFVDDEAPQTQPNDGVDMRAVYLQSVRSPVKRTLKVGEQNIDDSVSDRTTEAEFNSEDDEVEDSFVVDNDFVEYDSEFPGETMLAFDPIINAELEKKAGETRAKISKKRRRILSFSDSSDNSNTPKKTTLMTSSSKLGSTPMDFSTLRVPAPSSLPLATTLKGKIPVAVQDTGNDNGIPNFDIVSSFDDDLFRLPPISTSAKVLSQADGSASKPHSRPGSGCIRQSWSVTMDPEKGQTGETAKRKQEVAISSVENKKTSPKLETKKFGKRCLSFDICNEPPTKTATLTQKIPQEKRTSSLFGRLKSALPPFRATPTLTSLRQALPVSSGVKETTDSPDNNFHSKAPPSNLSNFPIIAKNIQRDPYRQPVSLVSATSTEPPNPDQVCIVVDSSVVSIAAIVTSTLRHQFGVQTYISSVAPASYVVSKRIGVFRQVYSTFVCSVNRSRLITHFRQLLHVYKKVVVIVEKDSKVDSLVLPRSFYLNAISCACAQLSQLKILFSSDQEETADLLWTLLRQEKLKGYSIPPLPSGNPKFEQAVKFYRHIPRISRVSSILLALNFCSIREAVNSDIEDLKKMANMSFESASFFKVYFRRRFRKDFLQSNLKKKEDI